MTYKKQLYERAAGWFKQTGDYLAALNFFYLADDFDSLLGTLELGRVL